MALLLCAIVGIFVLTQAFGKRLSQFTTDLCQTLDHMIAGNEAPQRPEDSETQLARIGHRLARLYQIMQENRRRVDEERQELQTLVSDISHQVKTPVSNLKMATDTLLEKPMAEAERTDFIRGIRSQTDLISILCEPGDEQMIYVVANASPALFAGVTNLAGFKAKLMLLSETTKVAGSGDATDAQKPSNLPMLGIVNKQNLTAGAEATATAELTRLVARVSISSIKTAFDKAGQFKDATFNVTGIYLKNANSSVNAEKIGSIPISGSDKANKYLYEAVASHTANTELTTPYYFYAFPNASATPTKLIIKGTFDADGTGSTSAPVTRYYPITINKKQANTTITGGEGTDKGSIAANTRYVLTAVIKGEGVDDDSKEIDPATLKLTVTVADWALTINQNVTFE